MTRPLESSTVLVGFLALALSSACETGTSRDPKTASTAEATTVPEPPIVKPAQPAARPNPGCLVPLPPEPPREAPALETCPPDAAGRPAMPEGKLTFVDAPDRPAIRIEHAVTDPHRAHGLMFRPKLADDEGMLFSWTREAPRGFWMHNTCLSLDMLFLDANGAVLGVLEHVPPMNDETRSIPCNAAHVLEVRAGYVRAHGVVPGQTVRIESPVTPKN